MVTLAVPASRRRAEVRTARELAEVLAPALAEIVAGLERLGRVPIDVVSQQVLVAPLGRVAARYAEVLAERALETATNARRVALAELIAAGMDITLVSTKVDVPDEFSHLFGDADPNDGTSHATESFAWQNDTVYLLAVHTARNAADPGPSTVSGGGLTWTLVPDSDESWALTEATRRRVRWFVGYHASAATTGAITIDHGGQTMIGCQWQAIELVGADTGSSGVDAFRQVETASTTSGQNAAVVLPGAIQDSASLQLATISINSTTATITSGSVTVLGTDVVNANPSMKTRAEAKLPPSASTTATWVISGSQRAGMVIAEIVAA